MQDEATRPLRVGGRRGHLCCAAGVGRYPSDAGRPDRAARAGVRLEPRDHLAVDRHQHRALRSDRPIRRLCDGSLSGCGASCSLAIALLVGAVALSTRMHAQWQLMMLWGVLVGAGSGVTSMVLAAVVATRWFDERRGLVLGALSAANATGQLVFLPTLAQHHRTSGWRSATFAVACGGRGHLRGRAALHARSTRGHRAPARTAGVPVMRLRIHAAVARADCGAAPRHGVHARSGFSRARSSCAAQARTGSIGTHLIAACHDVGIPEMRAAQLLAVMGIFDILGTIASGWLTDRVLQPLSALRLLHGARVCRCCFCHSC